MKIALFSDNFYPEISGISDSIMTLGKELVRRGHEIAFVGPHYSHKNYEHGKRAPDSVALTQFKIHRVPSIVYPGSPTHQGRIALPYISNSTLAFIKGFKPDVIHTQSPFGVGIEALRVSKALSIPLIGTNHTPIGEFMAYSPIRGDFALSATYTFFIWYYNHCLKITTPSLDLQTEMKQHGLRVEAEVMPNPLELGDFTYTHEEERKKIKQELNINHPFILYVGRLAPEKHVDSIVIALKKVVTEFPDARLVITGHGSAEDSLKKLVADLGLIHNVIFTGFVEKEKLVKLYKAADIFCIMSTAETQSIALMQGFAVGIPAVGADARAFKEYIPPECGFRMEYNDTAALAEKLVYLFKNPDMRHMMGKAGSNFVQKFSTLHIADAWEKVYNSVIHRHA